MKQQRPLVEALQQFVRNEPHSLHVPGHKNGIFSALPNEIKAAMQFDVTELTGLDDLHHPEEAILEAEQLLAQTYGADKSFFLVNGSTVGNLAMIYATCRAGDTILVQRNAHKSIFHALELVGVEPVYLAPEWHEESRSAGHVPTETIQKAIKRYPHAKAVVLTSPTYYGVATEQLTKQIILCHEAGIPVLVDEAHGAHLIASHYLPSGALALGADIVVQSAHKTLPAMTMASFMHVRSSLVDAKKVNHYLRMLQSSSPSYLLLASLDDARAFIADYTEIDFAAFMDKRSYFIEAISGIEGLEVIEVDDKLKLLLRASGYTGFQLKATLEAHHVYVELADREQVLLILPLMKQGQIYPFADIRLRMKEAMVTLLRQPVEVLQPIKGMTLPAIMQPEYTYEKLRQAEIEWIPYMRAIGRVSAEMLIPYPPGIPLFVVGEKITVAKLSQLEEMLDIGASFQGEHRLQEKCIAVIKS